MCILTSYIDDVDIVDPSSPCNKSIWMVNCGIGIAQWNNYWMKCIGSFSSLGGQKHVHTSCKI